MAYNPFRHFWPKAVAVGIAVLLWFMVAGEKQVERSLRAPLELQNMPASLELVGDAPTAVDVRVRGSSSALGRLPQGDVMAVLDVATAKPGRNYFHLAPSSVRVPFGVDVTYTGPATIALAFEPQVVKRVPVVPVIEGEAAPGHAVARVTVSPSEVEVIGPESALAALRQATTEAIALKGATGQLRETVAVGILNSAARLRTSQGAEVTIDIEPVQVERSLAAIPVRVTGLGARLSARAQPAAVTVVLRGPAAVLDALKTDDVTAEADLAGAGAGRRTVAVRVAPPAGSTVVRVVPSEVRVTVR